MREAAARMKQRLEDVISYTKHQDDKNKEEKILWFTILIINYELIICQQINK